MSEERDEPREQRPMTEAEFVEACRDTVWRARYLEGWFRRKCYGEKVFGRR